MTLYCVAVLVLWKIRKIAQETAEQNTRVNKDHAADFTELADVGHMY